MPSSIIIGHRGYFFRGRSLTGEELAPSLLDMKLSEYIALVDGSEKKFAARAGVDQKTVNTLCRGITIPSSQTALKIIEASQDRPAPSGEVVTLRDIARPAKGGKR